MGDEVSAASSRIFISYRREDSAGHVLALLPALRKHYGADRVFKDTDTIPPGVDFLKFIKRELATCSVMLAIIGREWLTIQDSRLKQRRLDNPDDFLRTEVATALKNERIRVVPVLVERSTMPAPEDLPPDLVDLAYRNAVELSDARWDSDVQRLIEAIDRATTDSIHTTASAIRRRETRKRTWRLSAAAAAAAAILLSSAIALLYYGQTSPNSPAAEIEPLDTPSPRPPAVAPTNSSASGTRPPESPTAPAPSPGNSQPTTASATSPQVSGTSTTTPAGELRDRQLAPFRATARDHLNRGQRAQALDAAASGLRLDASDAELQKIVDSLLRAAESTTATAKTSAVNVGAPTLSQEFFGQALGLEQQAVGHRNARNKEAAIRTYWLATERFQLAAKQAAVSGNSPSPQRQGDIVLGHPDEKARIREVISRYESAYDNLDAAGVEAVFPGAPDNLAKTFATYKSYRLEIYVDRLELSADGTSATARCRLIHLIEPKIAARKRYPEQKQEFVFQKQGDRWTITMFRSW